MWPPKRKKKKERGDASVLGGSREKADTRERRETKDWGGSGLFLLKRKGRIGGTRVSWGWVKRCGRKQKEGCADPRRLEKWKPRRTVVL